MTHTYTKTTWVDGTTPINATNLNKVETGVAQAILSTITAVAATASGDDYPIGVTTFAVGNDSTWPITYSTVVNFKNANTRFTQYCYGNGGTASHIGGWIRHWNTGYGWTAFRRIDDPFEAVTANGRYSKWHGGLLICNKQITFGTFTAGETKTVTWTYPHAFDATDAAGIIVNLTPGGLAAANATAFTHGVDRYPSTTSCALYLRSLAAGDIASTVTAQVTAIGRWKP